MVKQGERKESKGTRAKLLILVNPPKEVQKGDELSILTRDGERIVCPWELRLATTQMTHEEKEKARRKNRQDYMKKPATIEKMKERMSDPKTIAKRKEYAEREDVKERKKVLAARARAIRKELKESQPDNYALLQKKVEEDMKRGNALHYIYNNANNVYPHGPIFKYDIMNVSHGTGSAESSQSL